MISKFLIKLFHTFINTFTLVILLSLPSGNPIPQNMEAHVTLSSWASGMGYAINVGWRVSSDFAGNSIEIQMLYCIKSMWKQQGVGKLCKVKAPTVHIRPS